MPDAPCTRDEQNVKKRKRQMEAIEIEPKRDK